MTNLKNIRNPTAAASWGPSPEKTARGNMQAVQTPTPWKFCSHAKRGAAWRPRAYAGGMRKDIRWVNEFVGKKHPSRLKHVSLCAIPVPNLNQGTVHVNPLEFAHRDARSFSAA